MIPFQNVSYHMYIQLLVRTEYSAEEDNKPHVDFSFVSDSPVRDDDVGQLSVIEGRVQCATRLSSNLRYLRN